MPTVVNIDGRIVPPADARVSVFDRGFLYGDSVYEVVRTYGLAPFEAGRHLRRLAGSARRTGIGLPWDDARLQAEVVRTLQASRGGDVPDPGAAPWNVGERQARIVVTRGAGEMGLDPSLAAGPTVVVIALPLHGPPLAAYESGVAVWPTADRRAGDPAAKTGEHLFQVMAVGEARAHGAHEAVLLDGGGNVTEGVSSNVFAVREGALVTPPLAARILEGVTRALVLELAREAGIEVRERPLPLRSLEGAEEAFLTSTVREVLPVVGVGERPIGDGRPGPVTRRLHAALRARADAVAAGRPFAGGGPVGG
jgi:branched-chain amino acid aminotransferase